jgi:hypothetical protein
MLRAVTWCAKCLFIYFVVTVVALRFSWIFMRPAWQIAHQMHWTQLNPVAFVLNYFLPIFAAVGFLVGLIPFGQLGKALRQLASTFSPSVPLKPDPDAVPPILLAWLPVTIAFLVRFVSWRSQNSSVFDPHNSTGRLQRFFGTLTPQSAALLDSKWVSDRFIFTGPMLFLMACAVAVLIRHRFWGAHSAEPEVTEL